MKHYRTTSHALYDLKYHICWVTKYRYPVLKGDIATDLRDLIRQIASSQEIQIITGAVGRDHVHLFVSVPPNISISKMMQQLKNQEEKQDPNAFGDFQITH